CYAGWRKTIRRSLSNWKNWPTSRKESRIPSNFCYKAFQVYKYLIEDIDGRPVAGSIRWGTGNSLIPDPIEIPVTGMEFTDDEVEAYEFVQVSAPGYYTVILPLSGLWPTTHFRLNKKPSSVLFGVMGAAIVIAGFFIFKSKRHARG